MLFAATPECKQLCSSLVTPLLPLWGSVPAPRLVPCITTAAETAVLLWVQTGLGTMASFWSLCAFSLSFIKSPSAPADRYSHQHSTHPVLLLFYPAVVHILLGESLLLGCQLLREGEGWLRAQGLRGGGCPKQLPFPLMPGSPWSAVPLCCLGSCPVSQLGASGRVVNWALAAARGAPSAPCCPWHHCSCA